jgi:hypothetical protein
MKIRATHLAALLAMLVVSCATIARITPTPMPDQRPDDFSVLYEWSEGSLPPPYHYEYSITIGPGPTGQVVMIPDYPSDTTPRWTEPFPVSTPELDGLYATLRDGGMWSTAWEAMQDPPVGGSSDSLTATAFGNTAEVPSFVVTGQTDAAEAAAAAVRALVPQEVWDRLETQRQKYQEEHSQ